MLWHSLLYGSLLGARSHPQAVAEAAGLCCADQKDMGTGWVFSPPDAQTLLACMDNALTTFYDFPESWQVRLAGGMCLPAAHHALSRVRCLMSHAGHVHI